MGDTANNWYIKKHYSGGVLVGVTAIRHKGDENIDAATTEASVGSWGDIVDMAESSATDTEFVSCCASVWPGWSGTHLVGGNVGEFRTVVGLAA